ncbi:multidrug transporter subunit MdtN [Chachezhania antarctica]|uniref:multidrug transporter subunit MdtN n=1 Tax=Chachezhania antarctica TaxID=2340860 RepID=UPI000EB0170D|nr:multidrug transporter subunit MdtN [Chachezhania antarctica]|tara:strand:- start:3030 stop:4073 length:1044 start_codon:yes stop_codon:yes gene_type:complete
MKITRTTALIGALVSVAIVASAVVLTQQSLRQARLNPLSDDAAVGAEVIQMATSVPGRITALHVQENGVVKKGDILVEIEDAPYRLAVEQTRADLEIARAAANDQSRSIQAETANAAIAADQVERAEANLALATNSLERLLPMEDRGFVSKQQVDDARTLKLGAEVSLREAERQLEAADALVGDEVGAEALIRARQAALSIAEYELEQTVLRAPHDGRIVGLTVSEGNVTLAATPMFSLIRTDHWHVDANYTETVLSNISAGDCASVFVLSDSKQKITGVVDSVGWGVSSKDLIDLPFALPIVPKSLDWVRVQQRFPVRVHLIDPPADLMRVGASAVVTVHQGNNDC